MRQEHLLKDIGKRYPDLKIRKIRVVIGYKEKQPDPVLEEKPVTPVEAVNEAKPGAHPVSDEEKAFLDLLETMRRRGDS
jgi:hypothetical protein